LSPLPAYFIGLIVLAYWGCVVGKILRAARRSRGLASVVVPRQGVEKGLWVVWIPTILAWIALPFVVPNQSRERRAWLVYFELDLPSWAMEAPRWVAVVFSAGVLAASIHCWRYMGRAWRLGVDREQGVLLTEGPFRWSRHPIYTLGLALMVCTVIAVPSPVLLVVAGLHFTLIHWKVRVEERFLLVSHGKTYEEYRNRTGRFLPGVRALTRLASPRSA
jgi:protein-S-isoprenylcysteine O-methyltransferase Ste14